jgi:hypothetical protein
LSKGYKNEINERDLYSPTPDDDAHFLANELEKYKTDLHFISDLFIFYFKANGIKSFLN